ncbi:MAG: hypothetical protein IT378_25940 [Sandaracinaceae bacterium]|nr:hypothetical protein [Sandaracinaceae bacterium]
MYSPIFYRCLTHLDILKCDHGGVVNLLSSKLSPKRALAESGHLLTEPELLAAPILNCPVKGPLPLKPCKKVVKVLTGRAMNSDSAQKILLLENLVAMTDGMGPGMVRLAPDLFSMIALHEGVRTKVYKDSVGKKTIGIGLNLERDPAALKKTFADMGLDYQQVLDGKQTLTLDQVRTLTQADILEHTERARRQIPNFDSLSPERQNAIVDLVYNAGSVYKSVAKLINKGQFSEAADRLYDVSWKNKKGETINYRDIQPGRAARVIAGLKGQYVVAMPE